MVCKNRPPQFPAMDVVKANKKITPADGIGQQQPLKSHHQPVYIRCWPRPLNTIGGYAQ